MTKQSSPILIPLTLSLSKGDLHVILTLNEVKRKNLGVVCLPLVKGD